MNVLFVFGEIGLDEGTFNFYSNLDGFTVPFETGITRDQLLASFTSYNVPDYTTIVRVISQGFCGTQIEINLVSGTSTTTTTSTTLLVTTTTSTTIVSSTCGDPVSYSGGAGWPTSRSIFLGTATGTIELYADADGLPDRWLVKIDGTVVIDTGFQGTANYDFGGANRNTFKSWISSRIDPITGLGYPDFTTYPDDGFPRVCCGNDYVSSFGDKLTSFDTAIVETYGSSPQTGWRYTLFCPVEFSTTTTTSSTSSTTTTTTTIAECDDVVNSSGGFGYPSTQDVFMGPDTGDFLFSWATGQVPDRFIVIIGGTVVLDTGYQGGAQYDFGGGSRGAFQSWLVGKIDPITLIAYPDLVNFPDDGYPRVSGVIEDIFPGTKSTTDTVATVDVYAPSPGTAWAFQLFCVQETTTTTTTLEPTTTTTTTFDGSTTTTTTTIVACDTCEFQIF